jgi:hypothetical protein
LSALGGFPRCAAEASGSSAAARFLVIAVELPSISTPHAVSASALGCAKPGADRDEVALDATR